MRETLLGFEHPEGLRFQQTERLDELLAELPLVDIEYRGVFLWFVRLKSFDIYRMRLRLDEGAKTVLMQDERETFLKTWNKVKHDVFKGVYKWARETDSVWGRRADGSLGKLYSFTFDSEKLKLPLRQLISENGWTLIETKFS